MISSNEATDLYESKASSPRKSLQTFVDSRKKVALAAGTVILGGSALAWGMSKDGQKAISDLILAHDKDPDQVVTPSPGDRSVQSEKSTEGVNATITPNTDVQVARVPKAQSFEDTFKEAREQVGPGGIFDWEGNVYNTYYKEEWNSLSLKQRQEFLKDAGFKPVTEQSAPYKTPPVEPEFIETISNNGERVLCIDTDRDGMVDSVLLQSNDGYTYRIADRSGDNGLDMLYILDPLTQDVLASARIEPFMLNVDQVHQRNDQIAALLYHELLTTDGVNLPTPPASEHQSGEGSDVDAESDDFMQDNEDTEGEPFDQENEDNDMEGNFM